MKEEKGNIRDSEKEWKIYKEWKWKKEETRTILRKNEKQFQK